MRWGSNEVGIVLTRNEIWLLLHALTDARAPSVDWEGSPVEPWVVGELRARLQQALRPEAVSDVEERPVIGLDSDMGRTLASAAVRPLVLSDGYDLGSLFAACAERGWGASLTLPVGASSRTPAEARVLRPAGVTGNAGAASTDIREFVGLERPVVAFARALVGAAFDASANAADASTGASGERETGASDRGYDEHVIHAEAMNPGERESAIERMATRGWEVVRDDHREIVFRRHTAETQRVVNLPEE
jgi:hypothetical protein